MAATIQFKSTKSSGWISGYDFEKILKEAKDTTYKNKLPIENGGVFFRKCLSRVGGGPPEGVRV